MTVSANTLQNAGRWCLDNGERRGHCQARAIIISFDLHLGNDMNYESVKNWLQDKDLKAISKRSGIKYVTLWRLKSGRVRGMMPKTRDVLEAFIMGAR